MSGGSLRFARSLASVSGSAWASTTLKNAYTVATPVLVEALGSDNEHLRMQAVSLLSRYSGKSGPYMSAEPRAELAPRVVPLLVERLESDDPQARSGAAVSLGSWYTDAAFAVPDIMAALEVEKETNVRTFLLQSMGAIGAPPETHAAILAILVDPSEHEHTAVMSL